MKSTLCSKHTVALLPRREFCVICLLEERYALQDALDDLARATSHLLEQFEDLQNSGDHEQALGKARTLIHKMETNTFWKGDTDQ